MNKRLDYLDSIRGLAALLVVIGHFLDMYVKHNNSGITFPTIESIVYPFELGRVGVVIFFIISGFVVPYSFNGKEGGSVIKKFATKTMFRLYPAFWFSIFMAFIVSLFFESNVGVNIQTISQVLINLTMLPKYLGVESVQGAYWTLHLLFVFYALCCILFFIKKVNNNNTLFLMFMLFCVIAIFFGFLRYNYGIRIPIVMPLGIASMFLGALLRKHYSEKSISTNQLVIILFIYFSAMFVAQNLYYLSGWPRWFSAYAVAVVIFLGLAYKIKPHNMFLSYIGRISYSMYLLHMLVLAFIFNVFGMFSYELFGGLVSLVLTLILSTLLADISYRFCEIKSSNLCRNLMLKKVNS